MNTKTIPGISQYWILGLLVWITACSPAAVVKQPSKGAPLPAATTEHAENDHEAAGGKVTETSIAIRLEQGSGAVCTADSTYFVHATITADGPATASYEIGSTHGQSAAGNFEAMNGDLSPTVSGTAVFDQGDTQNIHLRFVGPYPDPGDITVFLRVNDGEFYQTQLSCQE